MSDLISRQAAIEALYDVFFDDDLKAAYPDKADVVLDVIRKLPSAQADGDTISRQAAIDARRYTFGNDEFSLEAAYHDCKMVFDGITDDVTFQTADTGLILYYANEIIYALQKALEDKDINDHSNCSEFPNSSDTISRAKAIEALDKRFDSIPMEQTSEILMLRKDLRELPPAQPKRGRWIGKYPVTSVCSECGLLIHDSKVKAFAYCPNCGAEMRGEKDG